MHLSEHNHFHIMNDFSIFPYFFQWFIKHIITINGFTFFNSLISLNSRYQSKNIHFQTLAQYLRDFVIFNVFF